MRKVLGFATPLCFLPSGTLVCYSKGKLVLVDGYRIGESYSIETRGKERILSRFKILSRLLRVGVRAAIALDEDSILLSKGQEIYCFKFSSRRMTKELSFDSRIRPLSFTSISSIPGFDDGIYFGGYLSNKEKKPVSIYRRSPSGNWGEVYTFQEGEVNHIHNIIPDPYRECAWIFSGDFGDAAAIWKATDNFNKVERVFYGDQKYRACVVNVAREGLVYATDSPLAENNIFLLDSHGLNPIRGIDGSCIYGCECAGQMVFESTVEPSGVYHGKLDFLFCWKKGPGIKDRYTHLYVGSIPDGFREVFRARKDFLPFVFQFGAIRFPSGYNPRRVLYFQPVGTVKHDLDLLAIEL